MQCNQYHTWPFGSKSETCTLHLALAHHCKLLLVAFVFFWFCLLARVWRLPTRASCISGMVSGKGVCALLGLDAERAYALYRFGGVVHVEMPEEADCQATHPEKSKSATHLAAVAQAIDDKHHVMANVCTRMSRCLQRNCTSHRTARHRYFGNQGHIERSIGAQLECAFPGGQKGISRLALPKKKHPVPIHQMFKQSRNLHPPHVASFFKSGQHVCVFSLL